MKNKRRVLSLLLAGVLAFGCLPGTAKAEDSGTADDNANSKTINLVVGTSTTVTDESGDYSSDEITGTDASTITTESKVIPTMAVAETGANSWSGTEEDLRDYEVVFSKAGGVAGTIKGNTTGAYLDFDSGNAGAQPIKSTSSKSYTVAKTTDASNDNRSGFAIRNSSNSNRLFMFGSRNNIYQFNRSTGQSSGWISVFDLYMRTAEDQQEVSDISGYRKITELSDITTNGYYLITVLVDGVRYILKPEISNTDYNSVGKLEHRTTRVIYDDVKECAVAVAGNDNGTNNITFTEPSYEAENVRNLDDCRYTFTRNTDGTWVIQRRTVRNNTVYLNIAHPSYVHQYKRSPNQSSVMGGNVTIESSSITGTYEFRGNSKTLYLDRDGSFKWDVNGSDAGESFYIWEKDTEANSTSSAIPGYQAVTNLNDVTSGKKYLIGAIVGTDCYILTPHEATNAADNSNSNPSIGLSAPHISKIEAGYTYIPNKKTEITFTGTKAGTDTVTIGDTTYTVNVKAVDLDLTAPVTDKTLDSATGKEGAESYYTVTTQWTDADGNVVDNATVSKEAKKYKATMTVTPQNGISFTSASIPSTVNVNVAGQSVSVPVTSAVLNDDGIMVITYEFENLFLGGSLRMDYGENYNMTCMRFGYEFELPDNAEFAGCEWYYGASADDLSIPFAPQNTKYQKNANGKYSSNIVFTGIDKDHYKDSIYVRVVVKYTLDGETYSKQEVLVNDRSVEKIARTIVENAEEGSDEWNYAKEIVDVIDGNASASEATE